MQGKEELLEYMNFGQYAKDFNPRENAAFTQMMAQREEAQRERIREDFYKYIKHRLPELFEVLEKTPERFVIKPTFEDGMLFNIEVKDEV